MVGISEAEINSIGCIFESIVHHRGNGNVNTSTLDSVDGTYMEFSNGNLILVYYDDETVYVSDTIYKVLHHVISQPVYLNDILVDVISLYLNKNVVKILNRL